MGDTSLTHELIFYEKFLLHQVIVNSCADSEHFLGGGGAEGPGKDQGGSSFRPEEWGSDKFYHCKNQFPGKSRGS